MLLKHIINSHKRDYIIEKANKPLAKAIIILAGRYDKPTHENVVHPNVHLLLDIEEEFFKCWDTRGGTPLYRALFRIVEVKYEHSPNWKNFLDWAIMMIEKSKWKRWDPNRQMSLWKGEK